ncbi:hypothetical protein DRH14_03150 [Candidatus Shapirobacteria bacterium]|nr:MAG: hypothetical protein DRH14_03150 [Candidatus Shapirobacteria bacterium]
MIYFLKIAKVVIEVSCPDNLYLIDDWKVFFEEGWGTPFLVKKQKVDIKVILDGYKTKGLRTIKSSMKDKVNLPSMNDSELVFDHFLNPSLFVFFLSKLIKKTVEERGGLILHASAFVKDNRAVLITGKSGSGKTTLLRQLMYFYSPIADDLVMLEKKKGKIFVYTSPLNLKLDTKLMKIGKFEVGAVVMVDKKTGFGIEKLKKNEALILLLDQTRSLLNNRVVAKRSLGYYKVLSANVYRISYTIGESVNSLIEKIDL